MKNEPCLNIVPILDYNEGIYINARRTTGILEIEFLGSPDNFCLVFTDVENIDELIEEYRTAVNVVELAASIARLGYRSESEFSGKALCSSGRSRT